MNKYIIISTLSLTLLACGGNKDNKEDVTMKAGDASDGAAQVASDAQKKDEVAVYNASATSLAEVEAGVEEAKNITKAFGGALKKELKAAMKSGGPINALDVCNKKAISITSQVAEEQNATISRVSVKNRNPNNVPNDWQKNALDEFDDRLKNGESLKSMYYAQVTNNKGKQQLRFMKPVATGSLCLKCHGSNISADVQAKLSELYPDDKATGYKEGQIRGAVVVIKDLK